MNGKPIVNRLSDDVDISVPTPYSPHIIQAAHHHGRIRPDIESPSNKAIMCYLGKWDTLANYKAQEKALNRLFWKVCPTNTNLDDVLIKVETLNAFYSTNLYNVFKVARHIVDLDIDKRLKQGDLSLVTDIATDHGIKNRYGTEIFFYSFATKYCSHHLPEVYPIYDRYVEDMLV